MQKLARVDRGRCACLYVLISLLAGALFAQDASPGKDVKSTVEPPPSPSANPGSPPDQQINVNWFYGSYVPKDVPLKSLTTGERFKLYKRQTFTT